VPASKSSTVDLGLVFAPDMPMGKDAKVYIYFHDANGISVSEGKLFQDGLWALFPAQAAVAKLVVDAEAERDVFQFLVMVKSAARSEIVANGYYIGGKIHYGPWISASYSIAGDVMTLDVSNYPASLKTTMEIENVPEYARVVGAQSEGDGVWKLRASSLIRTVRVKVDSERGDKLNLGIVGFKKGSPNFKSNFNILANFDAPRGYPRKYQEIKIDLSKVVKSELPRVKNYIVSIHSSNENFCVEGFDLVGDKWVSRDNHKSITIHNFEEAGKPLELMFNFIAESKNKIEVKSKLVKLDSKNIISHFKDYTSCARCRHAHKCKMFKDFMGYVGHTTILRQIVAHS